MPDLSALSLNEQLTYWVGAVARSDAETENHLRRVYESLCSPSLAAFAAPRDFMALHAGCVRMFEAGRARSWSLLDLPDLALEVLQAAKVAHFDRNRLVHDYWYQIDPAADQPVFTRMRNAASLPADRQVVRRELGEFESAYVALQIASFRLIGLASLVADNAYPEYRESALQHNQALALGRFEFEPPNAARFTG